MDFEQTNNNRVRSIALIIFGLIVGVVSSYVFLRMSSLNNCKSQPAISQATGDSAPAIDQKALEAMKKIYSLDATVESVNGKVLQLKSFPDGSMTYQANIDENTEIFERKLSKFISDESQPGSNSQDNNTQIKIDSLQAGDKVEVESYADMGATSNFTAKNIYKIIEAD